MALAGDLNKVNGDIFYSEDVSAILKGFGKNSLESNYHSLQASTANYTNRDNVFADTFTTSGGQKSTVGSNTANWVTSDNAYELSFTNVAGADTTHDPNSMTNASNAFDGNLSTYASKTASDANPSLDVYLGKTFTSKFVAIARVKARVANSSFYPNVRSEGILIETYNGSTWSVLATLFSYSGLGNDTTIDQWVPINSTVQGIRIHMYANGLSNSSTTVEADLYELQYGNFDSSAYVITTQAFTSTPKLIYVYPHSLIPTNTNILVDVSDDGGSTWGVSNGVVNSPINTSALTGTNIKLKVKLSTTDSHVTPKLYGYSVGILN